MRKPSLYSTAQRELAALLRELRLANGMTQGEVAEQLGRPQTYLSDIERGNRAGTLLQVRELAAAYGLPFVDFARRLEKRIESASPKTKPAAAKRPSGRTTRRS